MEVMSHKQSIKIEMLVFIQLLFMTPLNISIASFLPAN